MRHRGGLPSDVPGLAEVDPVRLTTHDIDILWYRWRCQLGAMRGCHGRVKTSQRGRSPATGHREIAPPSKRGLGNSTRQLCLVGNFRLVAGQPGDSCQISTASSLPRARVFGGLHPRVSVFLRLMLCHDNLAIGDMEEKDPSWAPVLWSSREIDVVCVGDGVGFGGQAFPVRNEHHSCARQRSGIESSERRSITTTGVEPGV